MFAKEIITLIETLGQNMALLSAQQQRMEDRETQILALLEGMTQQIRLLWEAVHMLKTHEAPATDNDARHARPSDRF